MTASVDPLLLLLPLPLHPLRVIIITIVLILEKKGWACYFDFPCSDSVIDLKTFKGIQGAQLHHKKNEDTHDLVNLKRMLKESFVKYNWSFTSKGFNS